MNSELFRLSIQSIRRKRRSSLLLFAVLFLSFAFAIVSLTVTGSIQKTNQEYRYDVYGEWYGAIPDSEEGDKNFLQEQEWVEEVGISDNCGTILTSRTAGSGAGIGVVDEGFLKVGRITLKEGRFPESPTEIAIEPTLLGYEYTLGQEVTFLINFPVTEGVAYKSSGGVEIFDKNVQVEMTFTLCGILQEYTDLWMPMSSIDAPLNSAIVTPEGGEAIRQAAEDRAEEFFQNEINRVKAYYKGTREARYVKLTPLQSHCFFTVTPGTDDQLIRSSLSSRRRTFNTSAYSKEEEIVVNIFTWMILAVTLLAVICIYTIRMQDEARQLAVFRSIGVTRRQLCIMLLYETLLLGAPAMVLGTGAGALGTWVILKLAVFSMSSTVFVDLPVIMLIVTAAVWIFSVLGARLIVFSVALRAPLTGRFHVARKKAKRYTNMRRAMIIGLSVLLCTALVFTVVESIQPIKMLGYLDTTFDYVISKSDKIGWQNDGDVIPKESVRIEWTSIERIGDKIISVTTGNNGGGVEQKAVYNLSYLFKNGLMSTDYKAPITEIPGVEKVYGWGQQYVQFQFDGMEDAALLQTSMANYYKLDKDLRDQSGDYFPDPDMKRFPPSTGAYDPDAAFTFLMMVDEDDWEDFIDFDTVDREKFRSGEEVLMSFYLNKNGKFQTDYAPFVPLSFADPETEWGETAEEEPAEGPVTEFEETDLGVSVGDTVSVTAGLEGSSGTVEAKVGGIMIQPYDVLRGEVDQLQSQYTIICSGAFLEKLMDSMGKNTSWHIYRENRPYGYRHMFVYVDQSAGYLSTDSALAAFCAKEKLHLNTDVHTWKQTTAQQYSQRLILLLTGGACVALVLLLILWNALSMEAERQKRSIGIQQALGMSKKQLSRQQFRTAALRGVLGAALGWLAYGVYCVLLGRGFSTLDWPSRTYYQWLNKMQAYFMMKRNEYAWNWTNWWAILLLTALCVALILGVSYLANRRLAKEDLMAKLRDEH